MEHKNIRQLHESRFLDQSEIQFSDQIAIKEGRKAPPTLRRARAGSRELLLKTTTMFIDKKTREYMTPQQVRDEERNSPHVDRNIEIAIDVLKSEERASRLADFLRIRMPTTQYVEVDGAPCVAYDFIEDVRDCGFGASVELSERESDRLREQKIDLAKGAIFKYILDMIGDGGQYLQDPDGKIYISDITCNPTRVREVDSWSDVLLDDAPGLAYFSSGEASLRSQLEGLQDPEIRQLLSFLTKVTSKQLSEVLYKDNEHIPDVQKLLRRCHEAQSFFLSLTHSQEDIENFIQIHGSKNYLDETREQRQALHSKMRTRLNPSHDRD